MFGLLKFLFGKSHSKTVSLKSNADRQADFEEEAFGVAEDAYHYANEDGDFEFDGCDSPEDLELVLDEAYEKGEEDSAHEAEEDAEEQEECCTDNVDIDDIENDDVDIEDLENDDVDDY